MEAGTQFESIPGARPSMRSPAVRLDPRLAQLMMERNRASAACEGAPFSRLEASLAVHCLVDLDSRRVTDAGSMVSMFRGYEALLPGRDLQQVGLVCSAAAGICSGVHATASALCLEMALGLQPPALGIVLRNLLLSCQYLSDNCMHLFVLAGPDYSQRVIERTNPEIWDRAQYSSSQFASRHGFRRIADIMTGLNKENGTLYREAARMVSLARRAYSLLGGKYPHSETIIPGGVAIRVDVRKLEEFGAMLQPFAAYSRKAAAIWDDVFDFMLQANPAYQHLGRSPPSMLDFGQWDHPDSYDGRYASCDAWGAARWSTPGVILDGKLACTQLSLLNAGLEECLDYSYQEALPVESEELIQHDPNGNPVSSLHPWNRRAKTPKVVSPQAYSWGSSFTWRGHGFEVGAYARLYLTALANKVHCGQFLAATGAGLDFLLPATSGGDVRLQWQIPAIWNAFERNRARAYALAFSLSVTLENIAMARQLVAAGETHTHVSSRGDRADVQLGVGLWGASRGFLAHWAVVKDQAIDRYQVAIPSRINLGTSTPAGEPGPLEKALINTPIVESGYRNVEEFSAIDIQRTIQSFDPCMSCSAHVLVDGKLLIRTIDTGASA